MKMRQACVGCATAQKGAASPPGTFRAHVAHGRERARCRHDDLVIVNRRREIFAGPGFVAADDRTQFGLSQQQIEGLVGAGDDWLERFPVLRLQGPGEQQTQ